MKIHKPPMTFKDREAAARWAKGLANNQDPYGNAVYRYASEWATRMEAAMTTRFGPTLALAAGYAELPGWIESNAKQLSDDADDEGITGFMYGCAISTLAAVWIHGEALRRWHNLNTQLSDEGERANQKGTVLNPAILNIG